MSDKNELTPIDNIQLLYGDIKEKNKLFQKIAKEFEMSPISVKTNWFYSLSIPAEKQSKVIEIMEATIANQKQDAA